LICNIFIQIWQFHPFWNFFGVGLAFSSIFLVSLFQRLTATSLFLVQFGYKLPNFFSLIGSSWS
jgi:hypothetical protein